MKNRKVSGKSRELDVRLMVVCPKPHEGIKPAMGNKDEAWKCGMACKFYKGHDNRYGLKVLCAYKE